MQQELSGIPFNVGFPPTYVHFRKELFSLPMFDRNHIHSSKPENIFSLTQQDQKSQ